MESLSFPFILSVLSDIVSYMFQNLLLHLLFVSLLIGSALADPPTCRSSQYYNLSLSQCLNCPSACVSCNSASTCAQCSTGYYNNSANICTPCSTSNCAICPNDSCIFCISKYELTDRGSCSPHNSSIVLAYLVGGICLGIIFFVTCSCYCFNRCREQYFMGLRAHRLAEMSRIGAPSQPQSQQEIAFDEIWQEDNEFRQKKNETCSFCLDPLVNLEMPCKHLYHIGCISQWLARHTECPICKRRVEGEAKLYCSQCFCFEIKFNAALITTKKVLQKRMCEKCSIDSQQIIQIQ